MRDWEVELAGDCYVTHISTKFKLQQPSMEVSWWRVEGAFESKGLYFDSDLILGQAYMKKLSQQCSFSYCYNIFGTEAILSPMNTPTFQSNYYTPV